MGPVRVDLFPGITDNAHHSISFGLTITPLISAISGSAVIGPACV
jgi:hypothetical protein